RHHPDPWWSPARPGARVGRPPRSGDRGHAGPVHGPDPYRHGAGRAGPKQWSLRHPPELVLQPGDRQGHAARADNDVPLGSPAMEFDGVWRAAVADEELRRRYPEPDFDDGGWEPINVPGHWRSRPAFSTTDGPLLYRVAFDAPRPPAHQRAWLTF